MNVSLVLDKLCDLRHYTLTDLCVFCIKELVNLWRNLWPIKIKQMTDFILIFYVCQRTTVWYIKKINLYPGWVCSSFGRSRIQISLDFKTSGWYFDIFLIASFHGIFFLQWLLYTLSFSYTYSKLQIITCKLCTFIFTLIQKDFTGLVLI